MPTLGSKHQLKHYSQFCFKLFWRELPNRSYKPSIKLEAVCSELPTQITLQNFTINDIFTDAIFNGFVFVLCGFTLPVFGYRKLAFLCGLIPFLFGWCLALYFDNFLDAHSLPKTSLMTAMLPAATGFTTMGYVVLSNLFSNKGETE